MRMHSSSNNSGDGASAFSTVNANNVSTINPIVETVQETGLNDDPDAVDLGNNVRVDLSTRLSNVSNDADSTYESGLQGLVIDTNNQGQADLAMTVGALGNASGTPLDGTQGMSFAESTVGEFTFDRDEDDGVPHTSGDDPNDPDMIMMLATRRSPVDP